MSVEDQAPEHRTGTLSRDREALRRQRVVFLIAALRDIEQFGRARVGPRLRQHEAQLVYANDVDLRRALYGRHQGIVDDGYRVDVPLQIERHQGGAALQKHTPIVARSNCVFERSWSNISA